MTRWSRTGSEAEHLTRLGERVTEACAAGNLVRVVFRDGTTLDGVVVDERQSYDPRSGHRRGSLTIRRWHERRPQGPAIPINLLDVADVQGAGSAGPPNPGPGPSVGT